MNEKSPDRRYVVNVWDRPNSPLKKKNYKKGQHGPNSIQRKTQYGKELWNVKVLACHYCLPESGIRKIMGLAHKKKGNLMDNIALLLESMLHVVVYRAGLASTMLAAKQMVSHKKVLVNGKTVNFRTCGLKINDKVSVHKSLHANQHYLKSIENPHLPCPDYITADKGNFEASINRVMSFKELSPAKIIDINLVISRYSRLV